MDAQTKATILHEITRRVVAADPGISPEEWHAFAAVQQDGMRTGPAIGEPVPDLLSGRGFFRFNSVQR